jgi:hypothetical protein
MRRHTVSRSTASLAWIVAALCALMALVSAVAAAPAAAQVEPVNIFTTIGITEEGNKQNSQIRGPYSLPAEEMPPSRQVVVPPDDDEDDVPLRMPNTSGTVANLAEFRGQTLPLREEDQGQYATVHFFGTTADGGPAGGDFTLRYSDGSTQTVNVLFPDWCQMGTAGYHGAIGPLSHRHTPTGQDGAPCGIFHESRPADATKTLTGVTLPPNTSGGGSNTRSYLMALTLQDADGFVTPDLGASPFPDDLTPPVSTHELDPPVADGDNGWYTDDVSVSLDAADEPGGSDVERTEYSVDGSAFQPYSAPFTVSGDGRHQVVYRSVDRAGNTESPKTIDVNIDGTPPGTVAALDPERPAPSGWYDRPVQMSLAGRDGNGSGAASFEYRIGSGDWRAYTAPVEFGAPGAYTVAFRSTDAAGNQGSESTVEFKVDATAPVTAAAINGAAPAHNYTTGVTVSLAGDGTGSGLAAIEYQVDRGAWQPYGAPFSVSGNGVHVVAYRSRDEAGNLENAKELVFRIGAAVASPPPGTSDGGAAPAPAPEAWATIVTPAAERATVRRFRRGALSIRVRCLAVERGVLRLRVSRALARRLDLESRTLAQARFSCQDDGTVTVRLKPGREVRRALRGRRAISAVLTLRMTGQDGNAGDSGRLRLGSGR